MDVKLINIENLAHPPEALSVRTVKKDADEYTAIKQSVMKNGFTETLNVTPNEDVEGQYFVISGNHRFAAAKELGTIKSIPCMVITGKSPTEILCMAMTANTAVVRQTPSEDAAVLLHLIDDSGGKLTIQDLAAQTCMSPSFITSRLKLNKLSPVVLEALDNKTINLQAAEELTKLPHDRQENLLQEAATKPFSTLQELVKNSKKELRTSGNRSAEFEPKPKLIPLKEALVLLTNNDFIEKVAGESNSKKDVVVSTIKYLVGLDEESVAEQKQRYDELIQAKELKKKKHRAKVESDKLEDLEIKKIKQAFVTQLYNYELEGTISPKQQEEYVQSIADLKTKEEIEMAIATVYSKINT
jgi:ParB/RepB/Spo0J family partition protein